MVKDFRKLLHVLESEQKTQNKLLDLFIRERAAVARLQHDQLSEITVEKEQLLETVRAAEGRIRAAMKEFFPLNEGKKLSELLALVPGGPTKAALLAAHAALKDGAEQLRDYHNYNTHLIRNAMGIVSGTMGVLYNAASAAPPTYSGNGSISDQKAQPAPQRTVLSREA